MLTEIPTGVIVIGITGPAGYLLRAYLTRNRYLPSSAPDRNAYSFINGERYFYHFTCDATSRAILSECRLHLKLEKDLIVVGTDEALTETGRPLNWELRGEIRAGQLFFDRHLRRRSKRGVHLHIPQPVE